MPTNNKNGGYWPLLILTVGAAVLMLFLNHKADGYEWLSGLTPHTRTDPVIWSLDPAGCPAGVSEALQKASRVLDHYAPFPVIYDGETSATEGRDDANVISCLPVFDYMQETGAGFGSAALTRAYISGGRVIEADVILNADRFSYHTALHEMGHMLGLGHSDDLDSLMCAPPSDCARGGRLDRDDLAGLAALYDTAPNCTPYWNGQTLYLPYIGGFWAELTTVNPADLSQGVYLSASGPSEDHGWECDLFHTAGFGEVETEVYAGGAVVDVRLVMEGGIWRVEILGN